MHPDEAVVPHRAAVDEGAVAYGDVFAQNDLPPGSQWSTALSCTLLFSPRISAPSSARSTAPYQIFTPLPSVTSPSTVAFAATKTAPSSRGIFPPKESIIVEKPPFSFASFMVFFIIALIVGARKPPSFRRSINLCSFIPLRGGFWLWS